MRLIALVLSVVCLGCVPSAIHLTPAAEQLTLRASDSGCAVIQQIHTRVGPNWQTWEPNVELATKDLLNRTAEAGADAVILSPPQNFDPGVTATGCPGCVAMTATALRCK